jgi:hypothetical protein
MNPLDSGNRDLDQLLERSYAELREPNPTQRQAVMDRLTQVVREKPAVAPRLPRRALRWISLAACAALVVGVWLSRMTSSDGVAFGIDGVPARLAEVQTICLRGWQLVFDRDNPKLPPQRLPFEMLVKRPGKFRHTSTGISSRGGRSEIQQSLHICDGTHDWIVGEGGKLRSARVLNALDARLMTETYAQIAILMAVLGPAEAPYQKIGKDNVDGRRCDLYESRLERKAFSTVIRIWIDPKNGLPVRLVRNDTDGNGGPSTETELNEISVNTPLADDLFRFQPAPGDKLAAKAEPVKANQPPPLDTAPVCSASTGDTNLELWHTLRIADNAALMVWRRSAPQTAPHETRDWFANIQIAVPDATGNRLMRHDWVEQSLSADRWNWSLVVTADRKPLGRGEMNLTLRSGGTQLSLGFTALRFSDEELRQLLAAAQHATLEAEVPEISLADLRAQAIKLLGSK